MGNYLNLQAEDGHELSCYEAKPSGEAKGRIIVIQEIFGVNKHIRGVCDGYAAESYHAAAPAIFDRAERGVEIGYTEDDMQKGFGLRGGLDIDNVIKDVAAVNKHLGGNGEVGIVGYCFGGLITWLAASQLDMACASSYYGGTIGQHADKKPKCPTICHFGDQDQGIPMEDVDKVRSMNPEVEVHVYAGAGHGFNCDERASYSADSAKLARERTLALFAQHLKATVAA